MRGLRTFAVTALGMVVLAALVLSIWTMVERGRDPLGVIHRPAGDVWVVVDSSYPATTAAGEPRIFRDLVLETARAGTIRVTASRPALDSGGPIPLIVVLAGLRTGRESLGFVEEHGPNLLVGYEYPYSQETFYQGTRAAQIPAIRRAVLRVPSQVSVVSDMLARDSRVDRERTALLGFSFGALFVPAVQRVAAEEGRPFHAVVLAFGGADIGGLLDANLRIRSRVLRHRLAATGATLLHAMEPGHHLPHLPGRFLLIRGDRDAQIPSALAEAMARLTPDPKEVVVLTAGHMGPRDPELTARVVAISQEWLIRHGVIDPTSDR